MDYKKILNNRLGWLVLSDIFLNYDWFSNSEKIAETDGFSGVSTRLEGINYVLLIRQIAL